MNIALRQPEAADYDGLLDMMGSASQEILFHVTRKMSKKYGKGEIAPTQTKEFLDDLLTAFNDAEDLCKPKKKVEEAIEPAPVAVEPVGASNNSTGRHQKVASEPKKVSEPKITEAKKVSAPPAHLPEEPPQLMDPAERAKANLSSGTIMTLAEMSFYDGKDMLERGDLPGAIGLFREAIHYDAKKADYYYYLSLALAKEASTRAEARAAIQKAIEIERNNPYFHAQLGLIYKDEGEIYKAIGSFNIALGIDEKHEVAKRELAALKLDSSIRPGRATPRGGVKVLTEEDLNEARETKGRKGRWVTEGVSTRLPARITPLNIAILMGFLAISVFAIFKSQQVSTIEIKPIVPQDKAVVANTHIEFRWTSSAEGVDYLLQIEQQGKKMLERYTRENLYVLSKEDLENFKPDQTYQWRVIPVSPRREKLDYQTRDHEFRIAPPPPQKKSLTTETQRPN